MRNRRSISPPFRLAVIGHGFVGQALVETFRTKLPECPLKVFDPAATRKASRGAKVVLSLKQAVGDATHVFLCVPTFLGGRGMDGPGWRSLARALGKESREDAVLVLKSTLRPGDAARLQSLSGRRVVACPEFMAEGTALRDMLNPSRVLVGGDDEGAVDSVVRLHRRWVPARRIVRMDAWSAQLAKLLSNAMLAQRISAINSVTALCERHGGDVQAVSRAVGLDPRIGPRFLQASPGFGGSCLEKDTLLLASLSASDADDLGSDFWRSVIGLNDAQVRRTVARLVRLAGGRGRRIALLGLAFKAGVTDFRRSPALRIAEGLRKAGLKVSAFDPAGLRRSGVAGVRCVGSPYACMRGAHAVAVLTEWPQFRDIDWAKVARLAPGAAVFDGRDVVDRAAVRRAGLRLFALGRG